MFSLHYFSGFEGEDASTFSFKIPEQMKARVAYRLIAIDVNCCLDILINFFFHLFFIYLIIL